MDFLKPLIAFCTHGQVVDVQNFSYSENRGQCISRLSGWSKFCEQSGLRSSGISQLIACVGEITNNSFDHNLGHWHDLPGKDAPFVADMQRKGIQVLALLPWYSTDTSGWPDYVRRQVQAAPDVTAWEIANEPEMTWWGGPIPAATYMAMLREAHAVIKAANKDARIVGPAVGANTEGIAYLESLITGGLLDYVDAVSVHFYVFHKSTQLQHVKRIVAGRKPLWITETGWNTADQDGGEDAQRDYIRSHYDRTNGILGADPAVAVIFHYELNDERHPAPPGRDDGWGLTYGPQGGFGRKSAYHEFRKLLDSP
jgi:hypothetical protein